MSSKEMMKLSVDSDDDKRIKSSWCSRDLVSRGWVGGSDEISVSPIDDFCGGPPVSEVLR